MQFSASNMVLEEADGTHMNRTPPNSIRESSAMSWKDDA